MGNFTTVFHEASPRRRLTVSDDEGELGTVSVRELGSDVLYCEVHGTRGADAEADPSAAYANDWLVAAARALGREYAATPRRVLSWARADTEAWTQALQTAGWVLDNEKDFVSRDLDDTLGDPQDVARALTTRTLADAGDDAFIARMKHASAGDPFAKEDEDPLDEWRDLVSYAGERFDPSWWLLVDDDAGPIGVLLPQATTDKEGTCFYLGVVPERRGQGWGQRLHALGLALLYSHGLRTYIGSTDVRNKPMQRVFARNGCPVTGTQQFFAWQPGT